MLRLTKIRRPAAWMMLLSAAVIAVSCSTKKNTLLRRTYHNLTSHYNVYWNGMDNMRQGLKEYQAGLTDNYASVLPVYNYGDKTGAVKISQYADVAIKKASKAINKHSMVFNGKEYVRWIDDSYLLIGKSYFYKQDYSMARRTFEFVVKTYNTNEIKYEAMLWMARSSIQLADYNRAEPMLDMLMSKITKGEAPQKLETDLNLTYGQFYILQGKYDEAVPYLNRALELKPPSAMEARCKFILGQIHQKNGELTEASAMYEYVVRHAKSYEMEFNAKINLAQCYEASSGNREYIVKKLTKMLKDEKNKDFLDQIHYALAHIALKDSDTISAIDHYAKSVSESKKNNYQKAISSLELADIFFGRHDYISSQAYYDSTMQFLPKDYPNYAELAKRTATLTDLVKNLGIIQRQDSLQRLGQMSEDKRNKVIDGIIAKLVAEEMKKQMQEQQQHQNQAFYGQLGGQDQSAGGSKEGRWYFYNPMLISSGFSTFTRKYGKRNYEDNWFLTDKNAAAFIEEPGAEETGGEAAGDTTKAGGKKGKSSNPKEREYYLPDIPTTKEQVKVSNDKIIEAYYQAGFIFVEGLEDYGNGAVTFESLQTRFPDNKYRIQTLYELYQIYAHLNNKPKSDQYKNEILTVYPKSDYAKLLVNPDYYKEIIARQSEASKLYTDTYKAFGKQQYYMVINNADIARAKYKSDSVLMPKFDYLRALALGKIEIVDSLVMAMTKVVKDYPSSPVRPLAENVLAFLGTQKDSKGQPIKTDTVSSVKQPEAELYTYDPSAVHFYVLVVNDELVDVEALKVKLSDYNMKFHDLENLMVNSLILDEKRQMITVNNFPNSEAAVKYFAGILSSRYIFTKLETAGEYSNFVISVENYPILFKSKDIPQYMRFFEKNYQIK